MLGLGNSLTTAAVALEVEDLTTLTTDLALWLKNGLATASQWSDASGNNNHATQSTSGNQAAVSEGGLDFEENNSDHYDLASMITVASKGGFCCAWVMDTESATSNTILSDTANETIQVQNSSKIRLYTNNPSNKTTQLHAASGTPFGSSKMLILLNRTNGSSGAYSVYKNGTNIPIEPDSGGNSSNADAGDNTYGFTIDTLGSKGGSTNFFDGKIYMVAFWTKSLSATEITNVNNYLTGVHGL